MNNSHNGKTEERKLQTKLIIKEYHENNQP